MPLDWSNKEVELIVADYFIMLETELQGKHVSKAEHRRNLLPLLDNRSEGSIEFKHQNISAVLANLGQPFIPGYKPRYNYQQTLLDRVLDVLTRSKDLDRLFMAFADQEVKMSNNDINYANLLVESPESDNSSFDPVNEPGEAYQMKNKVFRTNYLQREQTNSTIGRAGENLAVEYEKWYLRKQGKDHLADSVEWVSQTQGDGLGYDILSRNLNGTDKYIEVKTTQLSKYTPFYFSQNELAVSRIKGKSYHLYRFFNFQKTPNFFLLRGSFDAICKYQPVSYKGYF